MAFGLSFMGGGRGFGVQDVESRQSGFSRTGKVTSPTADRRGCPKPSTRIPKTLNPKPSTLNPKTLDPKAPKTQETLRTQGPAKHLKARSPPGPPQEFFRVLEDCLGFSRVPRNSFGF